MITPDSFEGERFFMCSFVSHNRMFIAGGNNEKSHRRRLYHVFVDEIHQLQNLPFDFGEGQCLGDIGSTKFVLFCADSFAEKDCWSWDGFSVFEKVGSTSDSHFQGGLQRFQDTAIIWAGVNNQRGFTETLIDGKQWDFGTESYYTSNTNKYHFSSVWFDGRVYMFGGERSGAKKNECHFFDGTAWKQTRTLHLNRSRAGHRSLVDGNRIIHVGGNNLDKIEVWTHEGYTNSDPTFAINESRLQLEHWEYYANAFVVDQQPK